MSKNIIILECTSSRYEELYPKTFASQISDVYSKSETSNLFLPKSGGSMSGILDMSGNKITNLAYPTDSLDSANKKYVDEKVGTWNTLFEKEDIWSDSVSKGRHKKDIYSSGTLDMSPLIQSKECKITLELFGTITVVNNASYSQSVYISYYGFPYSNDIELAYFTAGTSQLNVDGFQNIKIFNHKNYSFTSASGENPRVSLYDEVNFNKAIGCNESYKNSSSIYLTARVKDDKTFNFTNLHYKLKMEYKN